MTVTTTIARCPRCGSVESIYVRSDDDADLVCRSTVCREGAAPSITQASPSRRIPLSYKAGQLLYDLFWERWDRRRR